MTWDRKAPFDKDGNLLHYARPLGYQSEHVEWHDAGRFNATMRYSHYARGRSAAYMVFLDEYNHKYPMFLTDFDAVVYVLQNGAVTGDWAVVKRGQNFGIRLVDEKYG